MLVRLAADCKPAQEIQIGVYAHRDLVFTMLFSGGTWSWCAGFTHETGTSDLRQAIEAAVSSDEIGSQVICTEEVSVNAGVPSLHRSAARGWAESDHIASSHRLSLVCESIVQAAQEATSAALGLASTR